MKLTRVQVGVAVFWLFCVAAVGVWWWRDVPKPISEMDRGFVVHRVEDLQQLPELQWEAQNHTLVSLKGGKEPWTLVHFWATWCAPCVDEIPELLTFAKKQIGRVRVIAVSLDESWEDAKKIAPPPNVSPNWFNVLDSQSKTPSLFGSYQFPETYLLDSKRRIHAKWIGPQPWASSEVEEWFSELSP